MNLKYYSYYLNCPCILFEEGIDKGYYSEIEGVDSHLGTIISERARYKPSQVKLVLKTLDSFTATDATNLLRLFDKYCVEGLAFELYKGSVYFGDGWKEYHIEKNYNITWTGESIQEQAIYFEYMLENRFDIFNLIGKGLAIDINKVKDYLVDLND